MLLAISLTGSAALAQARDPGAVESPAAEIDALEPAVDTSASTAAESEMTPAAEPDSAAQFAADVTRARSNGYVMDRMELDRTEITGNQELPKVMYIVPWREADPGELMGVPVNSLLHEVLSPLDREEFVRNVDYYDEVYGESGGRQ
jgi:hypothetical protein